MPIYEYFCKNCNLKFELLRAISHANEDAACPKCKIAAGRIVSRFSSFSRSSDGSISSLDSSACSSCSATSCDSCH